MVVPRTERLSFDFLVLGIQDVEISADALQIRPMYSVKLYMDRCHKYRFSWIQPIVFLCLLLRSMQISATGLN